AGDAQRAHDGGHAGDAERACQEVSAT
ncbi:MAG: hypothetical protein JWO86_4175, partial [Myxococcaceae bacterium]|nr:hypothetical protein [Myxococcaceae bacterium]